MEWSKHGTQAARPAGVVPGRPQVYITRRAYGSIHRFARGGGTVERGGFLVGLPPEASGHSGTLICGFLPARYSRGTPATIAFTSRTHADARARLARRYPGLQIVGWMHTAPGTGACLSEYDRFIQARYFSQAHQVAYVVDPAEGEAHCFIWQEGCLECAPELTLLEPRWQPAAIRAPAARRALLAAGLCTAAGALALAASIPRDR